MTKKAQYLILADIMLESSKMHTLAELVAISGFTASQVDAQIATLRYRHEYALLVKRLGCKHQYGLTVVNSFGQRDFVTELFAGNASKSLALSRSIVNAEIW
ncbi:hypothetical protein HWV03_16325 [Moritella sp. 36]|uniref:hypothetical protein n=1 Tax=Moritella sp. 36 TaxID=2746233 RepID=UPI001BA4BCD7|nr:hypothetical protein [Moritella sp. 36]QUM90256.1 hypothetical protein HWV03_16325 [Moritella sp. 36]